MQVFKAYFKIIRKRLPSLLIYISVFVVLTLVITSILGNNGTTAFLASKNKIVVFNGDTGSAISEGLAEYLSKNAETVIIPDTAESIQDALFYGNIDYALHIPAGFAESFTGGKNGVSLQKTAASGTTASVNIDFLIERYLNVAQIYAKNAPGMPAEQIAANVGRDLANQANIVVNTYGQTSNANNLTYYFQYLAYSLMAVIIMGVTSFMMAFNDTDLNNRNLCSPMKPMHMNLQIVLGNVTFVLAVWVIQCAVVFISYRKALVGAGTLLLCLNALTYSIVSLSIGFLAGKFVRNPGVQNAVTNVVALGISFISGVFVEQALLGKTVLSIARFLPGYWYVKAVDDIRNTVVFSLPSMQPIFYGMLIQLGFAAMIFIVALVASKQIKLNREI
jgi:ABC-2 type transport system permease protein